MRIATLAEIAARAATGGSFDYALADFLDGFYRKPSAGALEAEPTLLGLHLGDPGRVQDAYLAAVAEELSRRFSLPLPAWTSGAERSLHRPWFAVSLGSMRAALILESPPGFRARNLFVSENALSRT